MNIFAFMFGAPWWQDLPALGVFALLLWAFHRTFRQMRRNYENRVKPPEGEAVDVVEFVMEHEDKFKIDIPDEDYERIKTVDDAIKYFEKRQAGPP